MTSGFLAASAAGGSGRGVAARSVVVVALLGLALGLRLAFFTGFVGSDDSVYLEAGVDMAYRGEWKGQDLASSRLGMVSATAAAVKVFGPTEFGAVVLSLVSSLLTHLILYAVARRYWDERTALMAVLLLALYPLDIVYATILVPEPLVTCALAGALLAYEVGRRATSPGGAVASFAAGALIGFGYLVKEPAALLAVVLGLTWLPELVARRRIARNWILVAAGSLVVLGVEALVRQATTGTAFGRFRVTEQAIAVGLASYEIERQMAQWWLYFWSMFVSVYQNGLLFYLLAGALLWAAVRRIRLPAVLLVWLVVLFGYLAFGSASFVTYLPLPKQPRYLEIITPPAILLTAGVLARFAWAAERSRRRLAWALLGIYAVTGILAALFTSSLERWQFEPSRKAFAMLGEGGLVPILASPRVANGLTELIGVRRLVHHWRSQACGPNDRFTIVVLATPVTPAAPDPAPPEAGCRGWVLWREDAVAPPPSLQTSLDLVRRALDYAPLPRALTDKVRGTVDKTVPRRVVRVFVPEPKIGSR